MTSATFRGGLHVIIGLVIAMTVDAAASITSIAVIKTRALPCSCVVTDTAVIPGRYWRMVIWYLRTMASAAATGDIRVIETDGFPRQGAVTVVAWAGGCYMASWVRSMA